MREYEAPFIGMCPTVKHSPDGGDTVPVPNEEIVRVSPRYGPDGGTTTGTHHAADLEES